MKNIFLYVFLNTGSIFEKLGISVELLISGFFGSLLLIRKEKNQSWKDISINLATGMGSSAYLTPFLVETLNIQSKSATGFFGFVVGFGSIRIVEFIINKYFKTTNTDGDNTELNN